MQCRFVSTLSAWKTKRRGTTRQRRWREGRYAAARVPHYVEYNATVSLEGAARQSLSGFWNFFAIVFSGVSKRVWTPMLRTSGRSLIGNGDTRAAFRGRMKECCRSGPRTIGRWISFALKKCTVRAL